MKELVIPASTNRILKKVPCHNRHPGLQLDKFSPVGKQEEQKGHLSEVVKTGGDPDLLVRLLARQRQHLASLGAVVWTQQTAGSLTLHLSRTGSLENAGICLHPLYGFVYFPGSGLKGMSRACAETIWLPAQPDPKYARQMIKEVFGWTDITERVDQDTKDSYSAESCWERSGEEEEKAAAGQVIFHEAWPEKWPPLVIDILNNHHRKYYNGEGPPGDWEDPVPVTFLAIDRGVDFRFAVSKREPGVSPELLGLAREWLHGALVYLGVGAKTSAGYGSFHPDPNQSLTRCEPAKVIYEGTLELVTPAFLAGAHQEIEDCQLRSATIKGLLRWWWRTLHAGSVDIDILRKMERAVWGDTESGSAVRVEVVEKRGTGPEKYDFKQGFLPKPQFKKAHDLQEAPTKKTTQGLFYLSYGMNDGKTMRSFVSPRAQWTIRLTARFSEFKVSDKEKHSLSADLILGQARCALALLTRFGGVGSKARKGFGAFADLPGYDLEKCKTDARIFRQACGVVPPESLVKSCTHLEKALSEYFREIQTPWKDCWFVLDQVGYTLQSFAQTYRHNAQKRALGLPRNIKPPVAGCLKIGENINRLASPLHIHIDHDQAGNLIIRFLAFPDAYPAKTDPKAIDMLKKVVEHMEIELQERVKKYPKLGQNQTTFSGSTSSSPARVTVTLPKSGDRVKAVLLEEKTKKHGWKALHEPSGFSGPITPSQDMPPDLEAGQKVTLVVAALHEHKQEITFAWPRS